MQGHAAANMVPLVAANRIGSETGIGNGNPQQAGLTSIFYGSSFIADHTGAKVAEANRVDETDPDPHGSIWMRCAGIATALAFFRDRRPEMYQTLLTSDGSACAAPT